LILNNTQKAFQDNLIAAVDKLKYIQTTLNQVTPEKPNNLSQVAPDII